MLVMKKLILIIIISLHASLFTVHPVTAQWGCTCLPEGIEFVDQEQIDSFQDYYPGCTKILGSVTIRPDYWFLYITNLYGLNVLDSIGGSLIIEQNDQLISLNGLDSLNSIGGDLIIQYNYYLNSLDGLQNLETINGDLNVVYTDAAIIALNSLDSVGGNFMLGGNNNLTDLTGLENLSFIGGDLNIIDNNNLSNCAAEVICNYLVSPPGSISIHNNATGCDNPPEIADNCGIALPCLPFGNYWFNSQADIDNFQEDYPGCKTLEGNVYMRGDIDNLFGLSPVTSITGDLNLDNVSSLENLTGLDNLSDIEGNLYIVGGQDLSSLEGLENLEVIGSSLFLYCIENLASMQGLENLVYIGGDLSLQGSDWPGFITHLKSLAGLESLTEIGGSLEIFWNDSLISLEGLDNLDIIGGNLTIESNDMLEYLTGLENLNSIGGILKIYGNDDLSSLIGIDHINAESISELWIYNNYSLSTCEAQSICDYLAMPDAVVYINNNAPGCDSEEEVEAACAGVGIDEPAVGGQRSAVICFPNPTHSSIEFRVSSIGHQYVSLKIYDVHGREVATVLDGRWPGGQVVRWDASGLPAGVYFYRFAVGGQRSAVGGKIVKY